MGQYLILKLHGPMQAWGEHTFEGIRPSANIPTKSAIIGILGACLGIRRNDHNSLKELIESIRMAVRADRQERKVQRITDYHTILDARMDYSGLKSHTNSIQTWREYLCDAAFTVALWQTEGAAMTMGRIRDALNKPYFTPLSRPSLMSDNPPFGRKIGGSRQFHGCIVYDSAFRWDHL